MTRFAFYGRVSTEDQQDPASSKQWQLARANALIEPAGGEVVAEFFDIGQSRSLPWKRRPESAALLAALRDKQRGFEAVVIGEPQRAFYGSQFGETFPLFEHYGVELWVPEIGGRIDPGSDAHDLVMSLYGGMAKGERMRIKTRVRSAMASQAQIEGRFLGGRPPYGYRLGDAGAHPNPSKAADGKRLHRLERDPVAAPVVARIFAEYVSGRGLQAIASGLTRDGIPSPAAYDPARNRGRQPNPGGAWAKTSVQAILKNPRYTGREVWNKQRRDEILLDVEDVAAGRQTVMRWNDKSSWVWSKDETHEAIVDGETFARAQEQMKAGMHRPTEPKRRATGRRYLLSGLVLCGVCRRRMQGQENHGEPHYRCRYTAEFAVANDLDHPRNVYLRESLVVPELDAWLADSFTRNADATVAALLDAGPVDEGASARDEAARRRLADCDKRLAGYRRALDAGGDPAVIAGWIREVEGERLEAKRDLLASEPTTVAGERQLRAMVADVGRVMRKLGKADRDLKARLYAELGLRLEYEPADQRVLVSVPLAWGTERVGGGTPTFTPPVHDGAILLR